MVFLIRVLEILLLGIMAFTDLRERYVHVGWLVLFSLGGIMSSILQGSPLLLQALCGAWILGSCLLAGKLSHGGIGGGDIWILTVLAFWENGIGLWIVLGISFILSAACALLLRKRKNQEDMPFVPFVFTACVLYTFLRR